MSGTTPSYVLDQGLQDAVAVVGMAGRFPRAATIEQFWDLLRNGVDAVTTFSPGELQQAGYGAERGMPGFIGARGLLDGAELFDAAFFGYHSTEATVIDPQQRVFLEVAWEALESAGYDPERFTGLVGVFAGSNRSSYLPLVLADDALTQRAGEYPVRVGNDKDYLATRVSYKLNLKGPSVNVQTACSTSLVAVCLACQGLQTYQCDLALAGGVSIAFPRITGRIAYEGGIYSPHGRCAAFDAAADGIVDGEGAAVVVLKRAVDAIADRDHVLAFIRGYALNNDGSGKVGFTAPSADGQSKVIAMAHASADVSARSIEYIEAHGTGTPLGDPIEVAGLTKAFRLGTSETGFCGIGSVKTNLGHLDAAAGVTGLIKAVLALKHRELPPTLHFERANAELNLDTSPFKVVRRLTEWRSGSEPRRAGVSSFGLGGTNAHVVLEEAPDDVKVRATDVPASLLVVSARTEHALTTAVSNLRARFSRDTSLRLMDVAYTLAVGRKAHSHRCAVVARTIDEAGSALADGGTARMASGPVRQERRSIVFMLPGGGAQYPGMCAGLAAHVPAFRLEMQRGLDLLSSPERARVLGLLNDVANGATTARAAEHERPSVALPALFCIEYALGQLWKSWGVTPDALIGHSAGEYAAACLAGVFTPRDAMALVAMRGQLFERLPRGAMLSVPLAERETEPLLTRALSFAAINTPTSCVVSGEESSIERLEQALGEIEVQSSRVHISVAAHSAMVEPILDEFRSFVSRLDLSEPAIPFVSNLTGDWIRPADAVSPDYWVRHLRHTVRFSDGLAPLFQLENPIFIEVGPGQTLSAYVRLHPANVNRRPVIASVRHPREQVRDDAFLMSALGRMWAAGVEPDWEAIYEGHDCRRVPLPTYPFERKAFLPSATAVDVGADRGAAGAAPVPPAQIGTNAARAEDVMHTEKETADVDLNAAVLPKLTELFAELSGLGAEQMDPNATFLDLGFESLFLGQAAQAIQKKFKVKVRFRQFFGESPTLTTLAAFLAGKLPDDVKARLVPAAPIPSSFPHTGAPSASLAATPAATRISAPNPPAEPRGPVPVLSAPSSSTIIESSAVTALVQQQLEIMRQQLALLGRSGISDVAVPAAAPTVHAPAETAAVESPTAERASAPALVRRPHETPYIVPSPAPADPRWGSLPKGANGGLTPRQDRYLSSLVQGYVARTKNSRKITADGRNRLADPRAVIGFGPLWKDMVYQVVTVASSGSKLVDVDGNEYIDLMMGFGATLLGHNPRFVREAIEAQLRRGMEIGPQSPLASELAESFCAITGSERMCFATSGTEAVLAALRVSRAVTGRDRFATFTGDVHGRMDEVLGRAIDSGGVRKTVPAAPGIPQHIVEPVVVLDYGAESALAAIESQADQLAAVLVEPVRTRQPDLQPAQFLQRLRDLTKKHSIALIMDEVVTGFRVALGGAQSYFGIEPDLSTWGKAMANGLPIGVVSGRAEFIDALDGGRWNYGDDSGPEAILTNFGLGGTFSRHPLSLAAAAACLKHFREAGPRLQEGLNARTSRFVTGLNDFFLSAEIPLHFEHFSSFFLPRVLGERRFESLLYYALRHRGVHLYMDVPCFLSTAHSDADLAQLTSVFKEVALELREAELLSPAVGGRLGGTPDSLVTTSSSARVVPLTPGQKEIWLACQMGPDASCSFNQATSIRLTGPLDVPALTAAFQEVVARHVALRTRFDEAGEYQEFVDGVAAPVPVHDFSSLPPSVAERRLADIIKADSTRPFDLRTAPLIRACLVRLPSDVTHLLMTAHHIVCDGWSGWTVLKEMGALYTGKVTGQPAVLPAPTQFGEYATSFMEQAKQDDEENAVFWRQRLAELPAPLDLPSDRSRPRERTYEAHRAVLRMDSNRLAGLKEASARKGITFFAMLLASLSTLLHRLSNQDDVIVGMAAAGQAASGDVDVVGHCVTLLPIRSRIDPDTTVERFLLAMRDQVVDAFDHQTVTMGELLERLHIPRDAGRPPLISVIATYQTGTESLAFGDLALSVEDAEKQFCNFDGEFHFNEGPAGLLVDFYFNARLFDPETGTRWLRHLEVVLDGLALGQADRVVRLPMLGPEQRREMLDTWNQTSAARAEISLAHLLEQAANRTPNAIAVRQGTRLLSYSNLGRRANRIAAHLNGLGLGRGHIVGLYFSRSVDMVVAAFGILRAGAAYLPLDPAYPTERLAYMLDDSGASAVLTERALQAACPSNGAMELCVEDLVEGTQDADVLSSAAADDLAYVIYTSGSTGRPKGVQITHRNVVNFLQSMQQQPGIDASDVLLAVTTLSFDIAGLELWLPLITGATVELARADDARDSLSLMRLLNESPVTIMQATPATWRMLVDAGWEGKSTLKMLCGGESLPRDLAQLLLDRGAELWNMYGPTETTIWSTIAKVGHGDGPVSIGRPIANTTVYVLDSNLEPLPVGVPGELYIGGLGVGVGYLNRPDLTAERFLQDPFAGSQARMYRTGDRARFRRDGSLEWLGRFDDQIKLRGFRIELGEIEAVLLAHPSISDAVVTMFESSGSGESRLAAYVAPAGLSTSDIRLWLQRRLPEYMVPATIAMLDALPRTPNGKVDRKALPTPAVPERALSEAAQPRTLTERLVSSVFCEVLEIASVGLDDDFFELGGHSLLAMRAASRITARGGVTLTMRDVIRLPTVSQLAAHLDGSVASEGQAATTAIPIVPRVPIADEFGPPALSADPSHGSGG
jgi:amino acid adenylation domain-containing protein